MADDIPEKYRHLFPEDEKPKPKPVKPKPVPRPLPVKSAAPDMPCSDFFSFDKLFARNLLTVVYRIIQWAIIIAMGVVVVGMFSDRSPRFIAAGTTGLVAGVILLLAVRIVFEFIIVIFRIYEELVLIRSGLNK